MQKSLKILIAGCSFLMLSCRYLRVAAQVSNTYVSAAGLPYLHPERSMIYVPDTSWLYAHHPAITFFKGRYIAMWSNGMKDEDNPGQRVVFSVSKDFKKWSAPSVLSDPGVYKDDTLNVLTAAGFHQFGDSLVAYYGEYSPQRTNTHLWARVSADGLTWSAPRDLNLPVNPNFGPQKTASGRLIISGNFSFPFTDDPTGLTGWKMNSFYPADLYSQDNPATFYKPAEKSGYPPLCEGSFFQTADETINMLMRVTGKGWKGKLWITKSTDDGESWSKPEEAPFSDNDSKFHFGKLPDGRYYYVGIPDTLQHYARTPLVISLSADGRSFNKHFIIADELYALKKEGLWKGGQYGYPHTMIKDGYMYVIVSRQKEAVEILRFRLNKLK